MKFEKMNYKKYRREILGREPEKANKYNAKKTPWRGTFRGVERVIEFDSKGEMLRFLDLRKLQMAKVITDLEIQVPFEVIPKQADERKTEFIVDFTYKIKNQLVAEDFKSPITRKKPDYVMKRKLFKLIYGPEWAFKESGKK